jgi:hypothetical protein
MTITIDLPAEIETALRKKASADGKDLQVFILETLKTKALKPSLDEILAPVRQDFEESEMSEEDLNVFIDDLREKVWQEKQQK